MVFGVLIPGVKRVVMSKNLPTLLQKTLDKAIFFRVCQDIKILKSLAKKVEEVPDLILVIENIVEVYSDPLCDDPQYVENLLGHSWKNDVVCFADKRIDRSKMTVILTCTPDYKEELGTKYRTDGFAWIENFDDEWDEIENQMRKLA